VKVDKEKLQGYIFTLEVAIKHLPDNANLVHYERLREMIKFFQHYLEKKQVFNGRW